MQRNPKSRHCEPGLAGGARNTDLCCVGVLPNPHLPRACIRSAPR